MNKRRIGRPRVLDSDEKWKHITLNMAPDEAEEFEQMRGHRSRVMFVLDMMDVYKKVKKRENRI